MGRRNQGSTRPVGRRTRDGAGRDRSAFSRRSDMDGTPLHPLLVHFPIALWLVGTVWLIVAGVCGREEWEKTAWILLAVAFVTAIPAVLTGQSEWQRLGEPAADMAVNHRNLGNLLPWLMGLLVLARLHTWLRRKKGTKVPWWIWAVCCIFVSVLIASAGWTGGHLVYQFGYGVDG